MKAILFAAAILLYGCSPDAPSTSAPTAGTPATGPQVSDAWVRPVPPSARMTAGYLSIFNPGPETLVIVGAESEKFRSIEIHGTEMVDGVARMRRQSTVPVRAGETVSFEPGGLHLILIQPVNGVPADGSIQLSLVLEGGGRIGVVAPVGQPAD
jgi:periplasmic copper chaperone A